MRFNSSTTLITHIKFVHCYNWRHDNYWRVNNKRFDRLKINHNKTLRVTRKLSEDRESHNRHRATRSSPFRRSRKKHSDKHHRHSKNKSKGNRKLTQSKLSTRNMKEAERTVNIVSNSPIILSDTDEEVWIVKNNDACSSKPEPSWSDAETAKFSGNKKTAFQGKSKKPPHLFESLSDTDDEVAYFLNGHATKSFPLKRKRGIRPLSELVSPILSSD